MNRQDIVIPATKDDALATLSGIGSLITARKWERAAIVAAFTYDGRAAATYENSYLWHVAEFVSLGIIGLTTADSVRKYRDAWSYAVEHGHARAAKPGKTVKLPDLPFPPMDHRAGHNPDRAKTQVRNLPTAEQVAFVEEILDEVPEVKRAVRMKLSGEASEHAARVLASMPPPREFDVLARGSEALRALQDFVRLCNRVDRFNDEGTEAVL
jgi:hypothetical protein